MHIISRRVPALADLELTEAAAKEAALFNFFESQFQQGVVKWFIFNEPGIQVG